MRSVLLAISIAAVTSAARADTMEICLSGFWQASNILQETNPLLAKAGSYAELQRILQEAGTCQNLNQFRYVATRACDFEREDLRAPIERMMVDPKRNLKEVEIILAFCRGAGLLSTTCGPDEAP